MKKIVLAALLIVSTLCLSGCDLSNSYVQTNDTIFRNTIIRVQIDDNYVVNRSHPYDIIDLENGIDVTVHFIPRESEN